MLIRIIEGKPQAYTAGELRRDNPNISFQAVISSETLAEHGVYSVKQTPAPKIDSKTHRHIKEVSLVDGDWSEVWVVVELPLGKAEHNVRAFRDNLLQDTDWIVIKSYERGANIPANWEIYRQALRDITKQVGFPYSVDWPVKPE